MKLTRTLILVLFAVLTLGAASAQAEGLMAERTKNTGSPYYLMVNRQMNTLTVFALGKDGTYSRPDRAMICSTGRKGHATPLGTFTLSSYKSLWTHMYDGSYGRYVSQFKGDYLIHSVCYREKDPSTLMTEEYNMLGSVASLGCIRLQVADAKWVFDNCPAGTRVTIYDSPDPGPLGKPQRFVDNISDEMDNGWEPTDPRAENPWREWLAQTRGLMQPSIENEAMDTLSYALAGHPAAEAPAEAAQEAAGEPVPVLSVTAGSVMTGEDTAPAKSADEDAPESAVASRPEDASERLPYADVLPGQWYYGDVCYTYENDLMTGGLDEHAFLPDAPVTVYMALRTLSRVSGESAQTDAFAWAETLGVDEALSEWDLAPERAVTRQEFALLLYSCETAGGRGSVVTTAGLDSFADAEQVHPAAEDAVAWAVQNGYLRGDGSCLLPGESLTRAQLAAIIHRYDQTARTGAVI